MKLSWYQEFMMGDRRVPGFVHGASVTLAVFMIAGSIWGAECLESPLPAWATIPLSILSLAYSVLDLKRTPEEVTTIVPVCATCDPEKARGAFRS